jgi:hypothetical protein
MNPSRLVPALLLTPLVLGGCYSRQPTYDDLIEEATAKADHEAEHFFLLSRNSSTFKSLSKGKQAELNDLWRQYHKELGETGRISGDTRNWIDRTDAECRTALVVSFDQVAANPTPEMNGQLESYDARRRNDAMVENENLRALADEWSRVWLMERPGGSPYNTVNTTGRF